ncbi:DUF1903-domain-containing protein [Saitoella complicata NRRL Y-17804]|uniref:Cx9C motif-containing protein 4, mitochondrial n=1 Tax=Saitoella complicata (strain BCRC 22490 / CBS 7301 / JCM 7358 / NBRC 10748 / NRRL Y-17804) TaxID=698492 RepID=A0A0E9N9Y9_SAICN|nr:DUF1903-domain-containing protein [Saitoella complicata NRRL Y-17804]ODQ50447.1 DUF1903-domain-containing protein [Saitoella complicata NRRL Y-17804]GAO46644.1 hypothetical protein G7K_0870-t1 [Saitoella complicata NRRL Y-17804]
MGLNDDEPCHAHACAIQNCIQKNGFNQNKCEGLIDKLYECCARFYKENPDGTTLTCPKPRLLGLKLKQRADEKKAGTHGAIELEHRWR